MSKRLALIAAVPLAVMVIAGVALAGITSAIITTDTTNVKLTITENKADNFYSGWHTHPGPVIVQVQTGYLKFYHGVVNCAPDVVGPGETTIETPNVPVLAVAKGHVEWTTTLIRDASKPGRTDLIPPFPCDVANPDE
jgi:quercetin dioxygenase-like cupin family protein